MIKYKRHPPLSIIVKGSGKCLSPLTHLFPAHRLVTGAQKSLLLKSADPLLRSQGALPPSFFILHPLSFLRLWVRFLLSLNLSMLTLKQCPNARDAFPISPLRGERHVREPRGHCFRQGLTMWSWLVLNSQRSKPGDHTINFLQCPKKMPSTCSAPSIPGTAGLC